MPSTFYLFVFETFAFGNSSLLQCFYHVLVRYKETAVKIEHWRDQNEG